MKTIIREKNEALRLELIEWLSSNDSHGVYKDADSIREFGSPATIDQLIECYDNQREGTDDLYLYTLPEWFSIVRSMLDKPNASDTNKVIDLVVSLNANNEETNGDIYNDLDFFKECASVNISELGL